MSASQTALLKKSQTATQELEALTNVYESSLIPATEDLRACRLHLSSHLEKRLKLEEVELTTLALLVDKLSLKAADEKRSH
jgi:hypothetical protein